MLRAALVLMMLFPACAPAQGWETFHHDLGAGAAVCPYDDDETGAFFCFAIACLAEGEAPYIRVAFAGQSLEGARAPLQILVDGKPVARLFLDRLAEGEMLDFGIPVSPPRDAELITALMEGSRGTLIVGIGVSAIVQEITLRGSHAALKDVPGLCNRQALVPEEESGS